MGHIHTHNNSDDTKLSIAVFINILLTVAQVVGGVLSGSLSLIADALHNLSDAGAILVAIIAKKIGSRSANDKMTYGYKRAEIIGVLINSTSLVLVGIYLVYEAVIKYFNPTPINGWIVFWVAGIALVIDIATAILTFNAGAKENMNIKAAFIHNVSDALASLVVIIAGILIINYQLYIFDVIATLVISLYVIYHGVLLLKKAILILMQAVPDDIPLDVVKSSLLQLEGVDEILHLHVWQIDERRIFLEGQFLISQDENSIKSAMRTKLNSEFSINHCTIETSFTKKTS